MDASTVADMEGAVLSGALIERVRTVGTIVSTEPDPRTFNDEAFDGRLTIGLDTSAPDDEIARVIRAAGYVADVVITRTIPAANGRPAVAPNGDVPELLAVSAGSASELVPARQHRHIRTDLHRLATRMDLIGELVITRGRL